MVESLGLYEDRKKQINSLKLQISKSNMEGIKEENPRKEGSGSGSGSNPNSSKNLSKEKLMENNKFNLFLVDIII